MSAKSYNQYIVKAILLHIILIFCITGRSQIINLDPNKEITQYTLKSWTIDDGLSSNALRNIIQTKDGYIWLASYDGVTRFNGVDFITFNTHNTNALFSDAIKVFYEDKKEILWIGSQKGITLYKNNSFYKNDKLKYLDTCIIETIYADKNNNIWIGTNTNGLYIYETDTLIHIKTLKAFKQSAIRAIFEDNSGNIWVGMINGELVKYKNNKFIQCGLYKKTKGIHCFYQDNEKIIWVGTSEGIYTLKNDSLYKNSKLNIPFVNAITQDSNGLLWIASFSDGLFRYNKISHQLEKFTEKDGLPSNMIGIIIFDNEGILWGTTYRKGIFQIIDGKFTCYSKSKGLFSDIITAILQYSDNTYWIATETGKINVLQNGKISELKTNISIPSLQIKHLFKDSKENIWISTYEGLVKKTKHKEILFDQNSGFPDNLTRLCFEDSKGNIWVGTNSSGLHRINKDNSFFTINTKNGLSSNFIMSIVEDRSGNLIVGTKNGLNFIKNDTVVKQYKMSDGLPDNFSFNIYIDSDDILWISTNSGISRMENGKFANCKVENGLLTNIIYDILEDNLGFFWMPGPKGIMKVSKQQLNDFAKGKLQNIDCDFFDKSNGMKNSVCLGATKSLKTKDGKLWFMTAEGIAIIDPENIPINYELPQVIIEKIYTVNNVYYPNSEVKILHENKRFYIEYTALSYIAPQKIQFKYKLEPFENDWIEAGNKRFISYTNISPGSYIFKLLSTNSDGIWSKNYTYVNIIVLPVWYQTWWFRIIIIIFVLGAVFYWYKLKINKIENQKKELKKLVKERTIEINNQKEEIIDSILYAKRIQKAILELDKIIKQLLPEYFIINEPRDIVSGDFYWVSEKNGNIIIAVADCTGHGVPGAFMSMLGITYISEIVNKTDNIKANEILNQLREKVIKSLHQKEVEEATTDGMDISLCIIDYKKMELQFSGANNPAYMIRENELREIGADKMPIGIHVNDKQPFAVKHIKLVKNDMLYLFSDGYSDQFGGKKDRKFMIWRLKEILQKNSKLPINKQKIHLINAHREWKGNNEQVDDILIMGIRI
ncbi:MAG: SpoIIE family protein phosphatase [Bacteroidales bacterium]|nr:SpoIIE family protein phosphatase [Bacteroidales bacterium]